MNPNAELQTIRRAIDALDEAMADLLASRICLSRQAQQIKSRAGLPIRDETREEEIRYRYDLRWRGAAVVAMAILNWCRDDEHGCRSLLADSDRIGANARTQTKIEP